MSESLSKHHEELAYTTTTDDLPLEGVVMRRAAEDPLPVLAFYGDREQGASRLTIASLFTAAAHVEQRTIADADHAYSSAESEVARVLAASASSLT